MNLTVKEAIRAENVDHANQINAKALEQYHNLLNSFNTQATLIVGFALGSINHDNLHAIVSDGSRYCVYKSSRQAFGFAFLSATVTCISISLTCIAASFYITLRTQHYALHVGVREAVAMVKAWSWMVIQLYSAGLLSFVVAAISFVWLFAGGPNWEDGNETIAAGVGDVSDAVQLESGAWVTQCLPAGAESSRELQHRVSWYFAITTTAVFVATLLLGGCFLFWMKRDFDRVELVSTSSLLPHARPRIWR